MPHFRFRNFSAGNGNEVVLPSVGVTCVVGANSAGKSQLLRDLAAWAKDGNGVKTVIRNVNFDFVAGDEPDFGEWLGSHAQLDTANSAWPTYRTITGAFSADKRSFYQQILSAEQNPSGGLGLVADAFITRVSAGELSKYVSGELRTDPPFDMRQYSLLTRAFSDSQALEQLKESTQQLFSTPVFLDKANFPQRLRAGVVGMEAPSVDNISTAYAEAAGRVSALDDEGDGLRSFSGLAFLVLVASPDVLLLDEPEAFLHPGQARAVGRWLARSAQEHSVQIIVATHDRDLLVGLLEESKVDSLTVARISRDHSGGSRLTAIPSKILNTYWADPVLRYSNTLQGVFHRHVVICEGADDCQFYNAAADAVAAKFGTRSVVDNTLFISSSGKNGIKKLAGVLSALGVETSAIADFDVLRDMANVKSIIEELGGTWGDEMVKAYEAAVRHSKGDSELFWKQTKENGMHAVPRGQATIDFTQLLKLLADRSLCVVKHGELESFYRDASKPDWLHPALKAKAYENPEAAEIIERVLPPLVE